MKKLIAVLAALLMLAACFACAPAAAPAAAEEPAVDDDWAYLSDKGTLIIGVTVFEPMNYTDASGKWIGFDSEYAEALCAKLGLTAEFVEINWDTKEAELAAKSIDCIWNGLTMTEERKENMSFTNPYIRNRQCVIIKADNAEIFTTTESLKGASVVAEISSAGETAIADDENLKNANYIAVQKQTDALLEVKSGTADAAVLDYVMAKAMVGEGTDYSDLMIIDGIELAVEEYAVGLRLGSNAVEKFNEATAALVADGTMAKLAEQYGQTDVLIAQ